MKELWWLAAICGSILTSIIIYLNQIFKMPSSLLMIYRGGLTALLMLPFCVFFTLPNSPWFWSLIIVQGLLIAYGDKKNFLCSRLLGGEILASVRPLSVALVFVLWWVISPNQLFQMLSRPIHFIIIVLCMLGIVLSVFMMQQNKSSKDAFMLLLPTLFVMALIDINNKYINGVGASVGLYSSVFYYGMITAAISSIPNAIKFFRHRNWHIMFAPKYLLGGFLMTFCVIALTFTKNPALYYAQNPAYVSAIMAAYPLWIIIWNQLYYRLKCAEQYPHCNFKAVGILLISIIVLILIQ